MAHWSTICWLRSNVTFLTVPARTCSSSLKTTQFYLLCLLPSWVPSQELCVPIFLHLISRQCGATGSQSRDKHIGEKFPRRIQEGQVHTTKTATFMVSIWPATFGHFSLFLRFPVSPPLEIYIKRIFTNAFLTLAYNSDRIGAPRTEASSVYLTPGPIHLFHISHLSHSPLVSLK